MPINDTEETLLDVVQADRDNAAAYRRMSVGAMGYVFTDLILAGKRDFVPEVQFFARLRLATAPLPSDRIEATVDGIATEIVAAAAKACQGVARMDPDRNEPGYGEGHDIACARCEETIRADVRGVTDDLLSRLAPKAADVEDRRDRLATALSASLSQSYDCTRTWQAWSVGTMGQDDFVPVSDRIDEIVDEAMAAIA